MHLGWMAMANGKPVQKAVDSLIVRDMLRIAYRRTSDTVILLSGDGDLVPGAQEMVDFGIGFHLWGVALDDPRVRQSRELIEVADTRLALDLSDLVPFVRSKTRVGPERESEPAQAGALNADLVASQDSAAVLEPRDEDVLASVSALSFLTPVKTGAPSLRQLSTPDEIAEDQLTDQIDEVSAREAGSRYGQRWLQRIEDATLDRFLARYSRPKMPRRFDMDLLWYVAARGRDIDHEEERRDARNGFWDALEQHRAPSAVDGDLDDGDKA